MSYYDEFSTATQNIISEITKKERRIRKSQISKEEMTELLSFTKELVERYKENAFAYEEASEDKIAKRRENIANYKTHLEISSKDYDLLNRIFQNNKYHCFPKIIRMQNGKTKKRFKKYSIEKIARVFYTAYTVDKECVMRLLQVPDVHYSIITIMKDEFGDLNEYMTKKAS